MLVVNIHIGPLCPWLPLPAGVEEEIRKLVAGSKDGKVVAGMTQLLSLCQTHGLMQEITIHPNFVCCHVDNRDGIGLNVMDLHQLLDDISSIGFSHDMTNCICVEISSGDHTFMDFNNRIADMSDGCQSSVMSIESNTPALQDHTQTLP